MILSRFGTDRRRARLADQAPAGPVRDYLSTPGPAPRTDVSELPLLALDLETTGLDPRTDQILSVGFVPVDGLRIELGGAEQILCRAFAETEAIARREKVHMRTAAYILGVQRVAKAMELRGIYP